MLTKLSPEQIAKFWDIIGYAAEQTLPSISGEHPDKMNRVLSSALSGALDVWASHTTPSNNGDGLKADGIVLTRIIYDDVVNTKSLLIYCVYGYEVLNASNWLSGLSDLIGYAKKNNCLQIIAYTDLPYIIGVASNLGAESRTFLSFDVEKICRKLTQLRR